jgi:hypothetical protein
MHIQTHALFGWCTGNYLPLTARQRFCCMLAATLADLDGLGIVFGQEAYWDYHHVLGHNLLYGTLLSVALTFASKGKLVAFAAYFVLFHSHLVMDYWGSGPDWPILYWWPFSKAKIVNPHAWPLFSWQNISTFAVLLAWTVVIAIRQRRTPLEAVMPELDAKFLAGLDRRRRPQVDEAAARLD